MLSFDVNFLTSTVREPSRSPDATSEEILSGFISSTVPSPPLLGSSEDSRSSLEEQSFGGNSTTGSGPLNSGGEEVDSPPSKTSAASGRSKAAAAKKNVVIGGKTTEKPGHSYIALISMAIFSSPEKKLVLGEIYRNIKDSYPYYGLCEDNAWKNSIRHNLSLNECFIKNGRADNGKGHYWSVHPACEEDFRRGDFRRRQARRRAKRCHQQPQQPQQPALQHYTYPAVTGGYVQMTQMPTGIGGSSYRTSSASYHPYLPAVSHSSYLSAGHQSPSMPSPAYLTPGSSPPMPSPAYLTPGSSPPMPSSAYLTPGQSPPIPAPAYLSPGQGSTMTSPAYLGAGQSSPIPSPATSSYGGQLAYPSSYAASQYSSYPVPKPYTSTAPAGPPPNVTACQMGDFYSRGTGSIPSVTTSSQGQALTPLSTDFANIPSLSSYGLYTGPY